MEIAKAKYAEMLVRTRGVDAPPPPRAKPPPTAVDARNTFKALNDIAKKPRGLTQTWRESNLWARITGNLE